MFAAITNSWALLLGMAFLMLGNGLQGTLLGVRAEMEGFSTSIIGLVMSGYTLGFLAGSILTPKLVYRVGHIRVFAALASLASIAVLMHAVYVSPANWGLMRLLTGFCFAGLYVVAESWLNDSATNATRGKLLSVYMVVQMTGLAAGQLLLNVSDPAGFQLFILISVMVSLALIPILLTVAPAPDFHEPERMGLAALYRASPLGVAGALFTGVAHGALLGMGAVFGGKTGLSHSEISFLMSAVFVGAVILQWPIGLLSDRFDRRLSIIVVTFAAAGCAWAVALGPTPSVLLLFLASGVFGGLSLPLYSLCLAHTNDHLTNKQIVAASGGFMMVVGAGASVGPFAAATVMTAIGPYGFFLFLGAAHGAIGLFGLYRMTRSSAVPADEQGPYVPVPPRASPMAARLAPSYVRDHQDVDLARASGWRSPEHRPGRRTP